MDDGGDTERCQAFAVADAGELQQMRALHGAGCDDHLLTGAREAALAALSVFHATGAPVLDLDAIGARAGARRQWRAAARRIEVGLAAAMTQTATGVGLQDPDTLVVGAVVVGGRRNVGLLAGAVERGAQLVRLELHDVDRPLGATPRRIACGVALAAPEEGQHILVPPAGAAGIAPLIVFRGLAAHPQHAGDGRGAAQYPPARPEHTAPGHVRLGLGAEAPQAPLR